MCHIFVFLYLVSLGGHAIHATMIKRSVMMHVLEEEIGGVVFTHRIDTINGQQKELWVIDGQQVEEHEYFDQLSEQEALERKKQRLEESRRIREQQRFVFQEQWAVLKKIVRCHVQVIEKYLNKLSDSRLQPYLAFSAESFSGQDVFDDFIKNEFLEAQNLVDGHNELSLEELQDVPSRLLPYQERIIKLYQDTLQIARERSDDTRLLKDLLHLVSEAADV